MKDVRVIKINGTLKQSGTGKARGNATDGGHKSARRKELKVKNVGVCNPYDSA